MENSIKEPIAKLELDIKEKQFQIDLIKNMNLNDVNEEMWHMICETPLRNSEILSDIVKNIFKDASNISVGCNYVSFMLYGFRCYLPTSRCSGIEVDTSWYEKDRGMPKKKDMYYADRYNMKKYFDALDNKESWKVLFKYRFPRLSGYRVFIKFVLWFGKYKWKNTHRKEWEVEFKKDEEAYERNVELYLNKRSDIHNMTIDLRDKLLPELYTFTNKVRKYIGNNGYDIKEILEHENLSF